MGGGRDGGREESASASTSTGMGTIEKNRGVTTTQKAKVQSRDHFTEILIGRCLRTDMAVLFQWLRISP